MPIINIRTRDAHAVCWTGDNLNEVRQVLGGHPARTVEGSSTLLIEFWGLSIPCQLHDWVVLDPSGVRVMSGAQVASAFTTAGTARGDHP